MADFREIQGLVERIKGLPGSSQGLFVWHGLQVNVDLLTSANIAGDKTRSMGMECEWRTSYPGKTYRDRPGLACTRIATLPASIFGPALKVRRALGIRCRISEPKARSRFTSGLSRNNSGVEASSDAAQTRHHSQGESRLIRAALSKESAYVQTSRRLH